MISPAVSIVILNWNKVGYTKACLESIAGHTPGVDYEVVVWDNGSTEAGTAEYLQSLDGKDRVRVFRSPENLGFARGNNAAARQARGERILFLNNDIVAHANWLAPMVAMLDADPTVGIVGSKLLYPDGTIQHVGVKFDYRGNRRHIFKRYPADIPEASVDSEQEAVTGACMLMRKRLFDDVGGFDEGYLHGSEDIDLCLKVRDHGQRVMLCASSVLTHYEQVSLKAAGDAFKKRTTRANNRRFEARWGNRLDEFRLSNDFTGFRPYHYYTAPRAEIAALLPRGSAKVLDVGCAAGALGRALKEQGKASVVWGIELSPGVAKAAAEQLDRVLILDLEKERLPADVPVFDYIVFADVLEHLRDPWTVLAQCRRHLAPGGHVVASIPNVRYYKVVRDLIGDRWLYRDEGILDIDHVRFFTLATIRNLFGVAGLAIERVERHFRANSASRLLNKVLGGALEDFLTQQYLIVARPRVHGRAAGAA